MIRGTMYAMQNCYTLDVDILCDRYLASCHHLKPLNISKSVNFLALIVVNWPVHNRTYK